MLKQHARKNLHANFKENWNVVQKQAQRILDLYFTLICNVCPVTLNSEPIHECWHCGIY